MGYGHASVAEHAVVHLAIEDVSIIATKIIEDTRLASYTEKSTRYVLFDGEKFCRVPRLMQSPQATLYENTVRLLLNTYVALVPQVVDCIKSRVPRRSTQGERVYEMACHAKAYDLLRYLLPAATLTNLGLTINARALEHLLTKLLSDPLEEVREIGIAMKREAEKVVPTLLKYASHNAYLAETDQAMRQLGQEVLTGNTAMETPAVTLVRFPVDAEDQLAAAILYGYTGEAWLQIVEHVGKLSPDTGNGSSTNIYADGDHDQLCGLWSICTILSISCWTTAPTAISSGIAWPRKRVSCCRHVMDTAFRMISSIMVSARPFRRAWNRQPMHTTISPRHIPWKPNMCCLWPTACGCCLPGICASSVTSSSSVRPSKGIFPIDALHNRCMLRSNGCIPL